MLWNKKCLIEQLNNFIGITIKKKWEQILHLTVLKHCGALGETCDFGVAVELLRKNEAFAI